MGQVRVGSLRKEIPPRHREHRVLVDAEWPSGIDRREADLDDWLPALAPSSWLHQTFGQDPTRRGTFRSRYLRQLRSKARTRHLTRIANLSRSRNVVLLSTTPEGTPNHARIILESLRARFDTIVSP